MSNDQSWNRQQTLKIQKNNNKTKIDVLLKIFGIQNQNPASLKEECSSKYLKR